MSVVHICAPAPIAESEYHHAPDFVIVNYSKFRHRPVSAIFRSYEWYDADVKLTTACGIKTTRWYGCTERRKPCRKCFPEGAS